MISPVVNKPSASVSRMASCKPEVRDAVGGRIGSVIGGNGLRLLKALSSRPRSVSMNAIKASFAPGSPRLTASAIALTSPCVCAIRRSRATSATAALAEAILAIRASSRLPIAPNHSVNSGY